MTFKTIIALGKDLERLGIAEEISTKIAQMDDTFRFNIEKKTYGNFLIISSKDKDTAICRGKLFCQRYLPQHGIHVPYKVEGR